MRRVASGMRGTHVSSLSIWWGCIPMWQNSRQARRSTHRGRDLILTIRIWFFVATRGRRQNEANLYSGRLRTDAAHTLQQAVVMLFQREGGWCENWLSTLRLPLQVAMVTTVIAIVSWVLYVYGMGLRRAAGYARRHAQFACRALILK